MAYPSYQNTYYQPQSYQNAYYPQSVPDQLAQLRQNQMQPPMIQGTQMAQPPMQQPSNPMAGSVQNGMIWVSGRQEADSYLISPNSAVALWDANNPVVYLRKSDSTGKPSTVVYDLVERTDTPPAPSAPQIDWDKIVTWEKLDEYLTERLKRTFKVANPART